MRRQQDEPEEYLAVRRLITQIQCAICHQRYRLRDVRILERRDEVWVIAVHCNRCGTRGIIFALVREEGEGPRFTELTPEEWEKFRRMQPIDVDEALDLMRFIRQFEGDFKELLEA